jgi:hypothetical protein
MSTKKRLQKQSTNLKSFFCNTKPLKYPVTKNPASLKKFTPPFSGCPLSGVACFGAIKTVAKRKPLTQGRFKSFFAHNAITSNLSWPPNDFKNALKTLVIDLLGTQKRKRLLKFSL